MARATIGLTLLAAALQLGCGTACDQANDQIIKLYADCDIEASEGDPADPGAEVCTDRDAAFLQCRLTCVQSTSCEGLKGTDPEAAADFGKCNAECDKI